MIQLEPTQGVPLSIDEGGSIRVTGSRVTLDVIVHEFTQGASAEQIQDSFPTLSLSQIYGVITYYLNHVTEVEEYVRHREREAAEQRRFWESHPKSAALRARLRALRDLRPE